MSLRAGWELLPELLRAWESRYGLMRPARTPGGFRLYTATDVVRVDRMLRGLDEGLSAAEAARVALQDERPSGDLLEDAAARLLSAIGRYDEAAAHAVLDESLAAFGLELVLTQVVLPTLKQVGDGWERGEIEVGQEHFASNLIRGRLLALTRLWGRGAGPLALLACAPGEMHDITLLAFALVVPVPRLARDLSRRGHSDRNARPGGGNHPAGARRRLELRFGPVRGRGCRPRPAGPGGPVALAGPGATDALRRPRRPSPERRPRCGSGRIARV